MKRNRNPFPSEAPPPPHLIRAHRLFALGYFCCTDHSTIRALLRRRPCLEESLAKPGKHTGHKPFRIGIACSSSTAKDWLREPKPRSEPPNSPRPKTEREWEPKKGKWITRIIAITVHRIPSSDRAVAAAEGERKEPRVNPIPFSPQLDGRLHSPTEARIPPGG